MITCRHATPLRVKGSKKRRGILPGGLLVDAAVEEKLDVSRTHDYKIT